MAVRDARSARPHPRRQRAGIPAKEGRHWLGWVGVKTLIIESGSPSENGYVEGFNGKLRDELLNGEIFCTLKEAKVLIEGGRDRYNTVRPHSSLGYQPSTPQVLIADIAERAPSASAAEHRQC